MRKGIGIDLGGTTLRVWHTDEGLVMKEPALVVLNRDSAKIESFGTAAETFLGENSHARPKSLSVSRPFKTGILSNCEIARRVFWWCLQCRPASPEESVRALFSVPSAFTSDQRSAVIELAVQAGCREPYVVDAPLAALYGAGFSVKSSVMIVHIGSTKTEIVAVHHGERVYNKSSLAAGDMFDEAIISYCLKRYRVRLRLGTAEMVKNTIGTVWGGGAPQVLNVGGVDENGNRQTVRITSEEMFTILEEPMASLIEAICTAIQALPLNAVKDIFDTGIVLTGGCAQLVGLEKMISGVTGVRCRRMKNPDLAVVYGLGELLSTAPNNIRSGCVDFSEFLLH